MPEPPLVSRRASFLFLGVGYVLAAASPAAAASGAPTSVWVGAWISGTVVAGAGVLALVQSSSHGEVPSHA